MTPSRVQVLRFTWHAVRLPVLALLITLLPVVQIILSSVALLGVLTAFFFRFLGAPNFPFWGMLSFADRVLRAYASFFPLALPWRR